jgi:hypothetical protein
MISSEVHRTLVKSPPELWTELSDQATLAGHLGELGEIRITRVEPERAVEWEAENISGTVRLKPSGWGTRVTLTVTREIPDPTIGASPDSLVDAEPTAQGESAVQDESAAQGESAVDEASARIDFESTMQAAFEPAADVETERDRETERKPPRDVQAESVQDAEPEPPMDVRAEAVPEAEAEPSTHVEVEHEPQVGSEAAFVLEIEHYDAIVEEPVEFFDPEPAPTTRRSFFSRLFRRRPRAEAVEPGPSEPTAVGEEPWLSEWPEPLAAVEPPFGSAEDVEEPYAAIEPTGETLGQGEPFAIEEHVAVEVGESIATEKPLAAEAPEPVETEESVGAETEEPVSSAAGEPPTLSAELEAAEQVAAEQVTMVLTAVLDRLGAAHHRPFSRA